MSQKISKVLSLCLACMMFISLFTGCGSNNSTTNSAGSDSASSAPAASAVSTVATQTEPVTIEWLAYNTSAQPDPESEIIKQQEKWFNIKFKFWYVDQQQWDQVLNVKLASGDMPDVMRIMKTDSIKNYVDQGVLAPITDDWLAKIPTLSGLIDKYAGADGKVDAMYNGKLYALKLINPDGDYPTVLVWRTDWLKNVGINKIPETIQEWEDALYKFRNNDPDQNGKKDTYGMSNTVIPAVFGAYGAIPLSAFTGKNVNSPNWTKKDGKFVFASTQPEMKQALTLLAKWYKDGVLDPEFITGENTGGYWALSQAFENSKIGVTGNVAFYHYNPPLPESGTSGAGPCYDDFIKVNPNAKFGETFDIGKAPVGPDGKSGTPQWGANTNGGMGFTTKFAKDQKKVDAVFNMINVLSTDYDKFVFAYAGVKDKHYTIDPASGNIAATKEYSAADVLTKEGLQVTTTTCQNPEYYKKLAPLLYQFADKYKGTGYVNPVLPTIDANTKYIADLSKLSTDAYIKIITGAKPVDYFDEYVKDFYAKGGTEIEKQMNDTVSKLSGK